MDIKREKIKEIKQHLIDLRTSHKWREDEENDESINELIEEVQQLLQKDRHPPVS